MGGGGGRGRRLLDLVQGLLLPLGPHESHSGALLGGGPHQGESGEVMTSCRRERKRTAPLMALIKQAQASDLMLPDNLPLLYKNCSELAG